MGLPKGKTNNPKGRPRGAQNKVTKELRVLVKEFLERKMTDIDTVFDELQPREKAKFITDMLGFSLPKYQMLEKEPEPDNSVNLYEIINKQLEKQHNDEKN